MISRSGNFGVVRAPIVSEKASRLGEGGTYTFLVHPKANKIMIREAVTKRFSVDVLDVRVSQIPGKRIQRGRHTGWKTGFRKAFVKIKEGQKIDII